MGDLMSRRGRGVLPKWKPTPYEAHLIGLIDGMKNKDLAARLRELHLLRVASIQANPRTPIKGFGNVKTRYIPLKADYLEVISELNAANKASEIQIDVLITLSAEMDRMIYAYKPPLLSDLDQIEN